VDAQLIGDKTIVVRGRFLKTAKLRDEYYVSVDSVDDFIAGIRSSGLHVDLLTFVQDIHDRAPIYEFPCEWDHLAVLPITTYDNWWKTQVKDKTRNMVRKAQKSGVEVRVTEFTDDLVRGIQEVYSETPIRQGKRNVHYGKDFDAIKNEHQTFLESSTFIGAFHKGELIGFAKVTHTKNHSGLMNIVAMILHRDKAPTNALIAKAVEVWAERGSPFLNYSVWGKSGLNDFKVANGFQHFEVPRYFVPLSPKGRLALKLNLHHRLTDLLPEKCVAWGTAARSQWNAFKYRNNTLGRGSSSIGRASR
jgi:hypothetical protein